MSALRTTMQLFHTALLDKDDAPAVALLRANERLSRQRQMAIYIQGYRTRLVLAIRSDYPALLALLGEQAFDALALAYIEATPPAHYSLDYYPHAFAPFVRAHSDAFAADVARFEATVAELFLASDAAPESEPLAASTLAGLTPEAFGHTLLALRPASRLLEFSYPVDSYLAALRDDPQAAQPAAQTRYMFFVRHDNEVKRHPLSQAQYRLLCAFAAGQPVGVALDSVAEALPTEVPDMVAHLQQWFAQWTRDGFFHSATEAL